MWSVRINSTMLIAFVIVLIIGWDKKLVTGISTECVLADMFECDSNRTECIPLEWRCDNETDCPNSTADEENCLNHTCPTHGYFRCSNGQCIPDRWLCDDDDDCPEAEDEKDCPPTCAENEFECRNTRCISNDTVCDRKNDCLDWSDEMNCNYTHVGTCDDGLWPCGDGRCIDSRFVCDNDPDCLHKQDEQKCRISSCNEGEFRCSETQCIPHPWKCDGERDCPNGSDEVGCEGPLWAERNSPGHRKATIRHKTIADVLWPKKKHRLKEKSSPDTFNLKPDNYE